MKTYIVSYMLEREDNTFHDGYTVFCELSKKKNKKAAKRYYKDMLKREDLYSINISRLTKSTEHYE